MICERNPSLGRRRQEDLWSTMASHLIELMDSSSMRDCVSESKVECQVWWCHPLLLKQEDFWKFEANLAYIASSKPTKAVKCLKAKDLWSWNE